MILFATDLDRTLIPNGPEEFTGRIRDFFEKVSGTKDSVLVYVTGRNLELFKSAQVEFDLRTPDFLLGSVGSEIYKKNLDGGLEPFSEWFDFLKEKHPNWNREKIISEISLDEDFSLQEPEVQNEYKISFYLNLDKKEEILEEIKNYVKQNQIDAEIVYSVDPLKKIGLLDILPTHATKKGSLEFLINKLKADKEKIIFSGDSGNDLLALTMGVKSILVNNASNEVKEEALKIAQNKGLENKLYIAKNNYSEGILEGYKYFGF